MKILAISDLHTTGLKGLGRYVRDCALVLVAGDFTDLVVDGAVFATGSNFPDALAAGPLAGRDGGVVLLVDGPSSPAVSYAAGFAGKVSRAYVAGGENAVSRDTADAVADRLGLNRP